MRTWKKFFLTLVLLLGLSGVSQAMRPFFFFMENPMEGQAAPDFTLKNLNGQDVNLTKARDGKPAILFFWATWCPHCREQLGQLSSRQEELGKQGIKVFLVDIAEEPARVRSFLEGQNILMDVLIDENGEAAQRYSILGVPTFFLVNAEGIVKRSDHALPDDYEKILKE